MRKLYRNINRAIAATAITLTSASVLTAPLYGFIGEPITVEASSVKSQTIGTTTYYEPINTLDNYYNPDYRPVDPDCYNLTNGVYGDVYYNKNIFTLNDINDIDTSSNECTTDTGVFEVRGSGIQLGVGSDITQYITNVQSSTQYFNRTQFYYTPCKTDTIDNTNNQTNGYYTFTAPITGVVKLRNIANEVPYDGLAESFYDSQGNVLLPAGSDMEDTSEKGSPYGSYRVEAGKKYTLRFTTTNSSTKQKFDLFFMTEYDNNEGKKTFSQDTWYAFNKNEKGVFSYFLGNKYGTDSQILRRSCLRVNLKTASKIILYLRNLTCAYEGWTNILTTYNIYTVDTLDNNSEYKNKEYKKITFSVEKGLKVGEFAISLPAGEYYIPLGLSGTDFAFKYHVTQTGSTATKVSKPSVTKPYVGETKVTGTGTAGSTVKITVNNKASYSGKVDSKGKFSIKVKKLAKSDKIVAKATYKGVTSGETTVKVANSSFKSSTFTVSTKVNNSKQAVLSGKCYKNATVTVKVGNKTVADKTTKKGTYSVKAPLIKSGQKVKITIKSGSNKKTITYSSDTLLKKCRPVVTAKKNSKKVVGKFAITNTKVTVKVNNKKYTGKVNSKGNFTVKTSKLKKSATVKVSVSSKKATSKTKTVKVK